MEIVKLISIFKRLIPIYENAYNGYHLPYDLTGGLCWSSRSYLDESIECVMDKKEGYYRNLIIVENNVGTLSFLYPQPQTYKDLTTRIKFMKSEIKDLKRLLKEGYTEV